MDRGVIGEYKKSYTSQSACCNTDSLFHEFCFRKWSRFILCGSNVCEWRGGRIHRRSVD